MASEYYSGKGKSENAWLIGICFLSEVIKHMVLPEDRELPDHHDNKDYRIKSIEPLTTNH